MDKLFQKQAEEIVQRGDVEAVRQALCSQMELAGMEYLASGKNEIFELFVKIREQFDGSEYQQGKKDGLRTALALLGMPEMRQLNRGGGMGREAKYRGKGQ